MTARDVALRSGVAVKRALRGTVLEPVVTSRLSERVRGWLARRPSTGVTTMEVAGCALLVPSSFAAHNADGFEPRSMRWLADHAAPGGRFLDIGAHAGIVTCTIAPLLRPGGRVISVEPDPRNLEVLEENIARSGLDREVLVVAAAAGKRAGRARLALHRNSDANTLTRLHRRRQTIAVEVRTVDELCVSYGAPDLVKIDVEGWEPAVLAGMGAVLRRRPPMLVELNPSALRRAGHDASSLIRILESAGYRINVIDEVLDRVVTVDTVLGQLDRLPHNWYANLACDA